MEEREIIRRILVGIYLQEFSSAIFFVAIIILFYIVWNRCILFLCFAVQNAFLVFLPLCLLFELTCYLFLFSSFWLYVLSMLKPLFFFSSLLYNAYLYWYKNNCDKSSDSTIKFPFSNKTANVIENVFTNREFSLIQKYVHSSITCARHTCTH